jgi:hypothetical protein
MRSSGTPLLRLKPHLADVFNRSARLAILFSIIRIDPSPTRRRRLLAVAALFFTVAVILITQLFWVCEPEPGWKDAKSPQCKLNQQVAICQLVSAYCLNQLAICAIC